MARNYKSRNPVYVTIPIGGTTINYGFNSGLKDSEKTNFGQTAIDFTATPVGLVFGCNSPKPYRASKKATTGYTSSFCSHDKVATLRNAGYTIANFKSRTATNSILAKTYYVEIGGVNYAWVSPNPPASAAAEFATLGISQASASNENLVFGLSMPKPARYAKEVAGTTGEGTNRVTIFVAPAKEDDAVTAGWTKVKSRQVYKTVVTPP